MGPVEATFAAALIGAGTAAVAVGGEGSRRTAAVLLCTWMACWAAVLVGGDAHNWAAFLVIDAVAVRVLVARPVSTVQASVAVLYLLQTAVHVGYGLTATPEVLAFLNEQCGLGATIAPSGFKYTLALNVGLALQILFLMGGIANDQNNGRRRLAVALAGAGGAGPAAHRAGLAAAPPP